MHTVSLTINLSDEEFKALGRMTAGIFDQLQGTNPLAHEWSNNHTLSSIIHQALIGEIAAQRDRDTAAKEAKLLPTVAPFDPQNLEAYLLGRILQ